MTRLSWGYGPRAPGWAMVGALLALCALLLPAAPASRADAPLDLDAPGHITDTVGALGHRRGQVEAALETLHATQHVQLYVTYVHDFSGRAAQAWADATADRNGFGPHDVLLAIATHGGQYAVSADKDSGFRPDQLKRVAATAVEPALKEHDWAGAAVGAADGYRAVLRGQPVRTPALRPGSKDPGSDGLLPGERSVWLPIAVGAALVLTGLHLCSRRSRRTRLARLRRAAVREGGLCPDGAPADLAATVTVATGTEPGLARMAQPLTPLPELDAEAAHTLVATDDAVHTSAEELLFATAQLGRTATRPFAEAVAYARAELAAAFRLRHELDRTPPTDEDARRHRLDEICSRCTSANRRLDAESAAFDRLRDLRNQAAAVLDLAETAARSLVLRLDAADAALTALARCRTAPTALTPVTPHPEQARDRLAFADTALAEARTALLVHDTDHAALSLRAAEAALHQARTLTTAVIRHTHELTAAPGRLRDALTEAAACPQAAAAVEEARRAMAKEPSCDPREVLRLLDGAAALPGGPARALLAARAQVAAARDHLATHRGAVGVRARTRLAEAQRLLPLPGAAARAEALARQARALAEDDVLVYDASYEPATTQRARALAGALRGGIVLPSLHPPTFGGPATRGRLGAP
ncbi:TPM domain-containing protein [Streptomyces sp. NPDC049555]|uniref:TPM domain-containing protein n=1 Tax=Streptomyces sp. NPDC049555 TaxID=3154930 RepID=UPI0034302D1B